MRKILAILVNELDYAEELASYLNSKRNFEFTAMVFSGNEKLLEYEKEHYVDYLLCDESNIPLEYEHKAGYICVLSDYSFVNESTIYPTILKYQQADLLTFDILRSYQGDVLGMPVQDEEDRIICVASPVGGSLKSTFALAMSLVKAKKGRSLFISFDPFFTVPGETRSADKQNLTDIIYYAAGQSEGLSEFIVRTVHSCGDVDYISGVSHWYDIYDATQPIIEVIMNALRCQQTYRYIVIDSGVMGMMSMKLFSLSDKVYVPLDDTSPRDVKCYNEWLRQIAFAQGDFQTDKLVTVSLPYDSVLANSEYTCEQLLSGTFGSYIYRLEENQDNNQGAKT